LEDPEDLAGCECRDPRVINKRSDRAKILVFIMRENKKTVSQRPCVRAISERRFKKILK
jgi:hypothetical protein